SPSYKSEKDVYNLNEGKIELIATSYQWKAAKDPKRNQSYDYSSYAYDEDDFTDGLSMMKTMTISEENPKTYNATFTFNNGIVALYQDEKMTATLENEPLKIEGHYLISSKYGLIKLSFNPNNGETWWVFEPKQ
ncbi:hypothetical protein, partial [Psychroserpens sp.]|uniref:hypothetical protein n=1 Tax=Psychroserpens sp. TaxID=2020870 RepID=UPI003C7800E9